MPYARNRRRTQRSDLRPARGCRQDVSVTLEYVRGVPIVKAYGQEGVAIEGVRRAYRNSKTVNLNIEKGYIPFYCLHAIALHAASVGIVATAAVFAINGAITVPIFLMLAVFSFIIFGQIEQVHINIHMLEMLDKAMDKLDDIKHAEPLASEGKDITLTHFDIEMQGVIFSYDSRTVLNDVSFSIPQHTTTAVVGASGSGKTTLCNQIARFYDADEGIITVGGVDVRDMTSDSLLTNISMVFQRVYLFHDSVRNNIRFGNPDASDADIERVAKAAKCHDFIAALPEGYDTIIGEGGSSLSGGEKQRISIARAMLKDAPIVILDEATASIDPENEHLIQQALSALTQDRTVIVIAHRLSTIEHADQILVMDSGRIAQRGTHQQLLAQEDIYRRFVDIRSQAEGWRIG